MPSGPKKRLRDRRKKQGSPATDANSDRDTEALSVAGSADVDDVESGLDTPSRTSSRSTFLDREALSSQTDEWIRVSDFDVGTPTSQIEESEPAAEDGDAGSSKRSVDKLAEWETVTRDHTQEGSINSPEDEPSEFEAASAHSSESHAKLPSPHVAEREKEDDSIDSDGKNRMADRSNCSSSSTHSTSAERAPASAENLDISTSTDVGEEAHLAEETITQASDVDDQGKLSGTPGSCGPDAMEANSSEEVQKHGKEEIFENATDIMEEKAPLNITALAEETPDEKKSPPIGKENAVAASFADFQDFDGNGNEKVASSTYDKSPASDLKEVASTSADAEEKTKQDASNCEAATFVEKVPFNQQDFIADSYPEKDPFTLGPSEPVGSTKESHLPVSTAVEKNGTEKLESKSSTGCCGVLYWLLGWDQ